MKKYEKITHNYNSNGNGNDNIGDYINNDCDELDNTNTITNSITNSTSNNSVKTNSNSALGTSAGALTKGGGGNERMLRTVIYESKQSCCLYKFNTYSIKIIRKESFSHFLYLIPSTLSASPLSLYSETTQKPDSSNQIEIDMENILCLNDDIIDFKLLKLDRKEKNYLKQNCPHNIDSSTWCLINTINVENDFKWKLVNFLLIFETKELKFEFMNSIERILNLYGNRPHRLAIFVNPISGNRKAVNIYNKQVKPIFEMAKIDCHVIVTDYANHAHDTLQKIDLNDYDGFISVGGDGLFSEIFSSLLLRTQQDENIDYNNSSAQLKRPAKTIGIIPAGSTDAACYCTTGFNDVETSVYQIVLGKILNIDVIGVYGENDETSPTTARRKSKYGQNEKLLNFCTTLLGYGYFGDIAFHSSKLRQLGPFRYVVTGARMVLENSSYSGKIRFKQIIDRNNSPTNGDLCVANCRVCAPINTKDIGHINSMFNGDDGDIDRLDLTNNPPSSSGTNTNDVATNSNVYESIVELEGDFIAINCVNMSCRCAKTKYGISPLCHTSNGYADLVVVRKTSRFNYIRYLLKLSKNALYSFADLPFVEVYRLSEFDFNVVPTTSTLKSDDYSAASTSNIDADRIELKERNRRSRNGYLNSLCNCCSSTTHQQHSGSNTTSTAAATPNTSKWNCDGEIIDTPTIKARVHKQLLSIYAHGLHSESKIEN